MDLIKFTRLWSNAVVSYAKSDSWETNNVCCNEFVELILLNC